jgi:GNAT superfamily N-acetyltransferase
MLRHTQRRRIPRQRGQLPTLLSEGATITLRPLRRGEVEPLTTVFDGLSTASRADRYLTGLDRLTPGMVDALTDVDGARHVVWVAELGGRPVGLGRYLLDETGTAEVAFEVVDAHQDVGIGTALVDAVTTVAAARGVRRVRAALLPSNRASRRLVTRIGVRLRPVDGLLEGEGELRLLDPPRVDRQAVVALAHEAAAADASGAWHRTAAARAE